MALKLEEELSTSRPRQGLQKSEREREKERESINLCTINIPSPMARVYRVYRVESAELMRTVRGRAQRDQWMTMDDITNCARCFQGQPDASTS